MPTLNPELKQINGVKNVYEKSLEIKEGQQREWFYIKLPEVFKLIEGGRKRVETTLGEELIYEEGGDVYIKLRAEHGLEKAKNLAKVLHMKLTRAGIRALGLPEVTENQLLRGIEDDSEDEALGDFEKGSWKKVAEGVYEGFCLRRIKKRYYVEMPKWVIEEDANFMRIIINGVFNEVFGQSLSYNGQMIQMIRKKPYFKFEVNYAEIDLLSRLYKEMKALKETEKYEELLEEFMGDTQPGERASEEQIIIIEQDVELEPIDDMDGAYKVKREEGELIYIELPMPLQGIEDVSTLIKHLSAIFTERLNGGIPQKKNPFL